MPQSSAKDRLLVVDAVRALALFGVLVMNLRSMAGLEYLTPAGFASVQGGWGKVVDDILKVVLDEKSLSAFSFLFGLSFSLLVQHWASKPNFVWLYLRRLLVLAGFGLLNIAAFYWADILITYAVLGVFLLLAARVSQRTVLAVGIAVVLGAPAALAALGASAGLAAQTPADLAALQGFGSPSYLAAVEQGFRSYFGVAGEGSFYAYWDTANIFGLFLLGFWTGRERIPHHLERNRPLLRKIAVVAVPLGLAISVGWVLLPPTSPLSTLMLAGAPLLAVGYLAAAALLLSLPAGRPLCTLLASTGQLALTNYLLYGLIGQVLFYGWGFDLIGTVGSIEVLAIAIAAYILLLFVSRAWLSPFRIGPAEWLWRCLTYLRIEPLRRHTSRQHARMPTSQSRR